MAERQNPPENPAAELEEVQTNQHLHQGLGVGARELASIGESGDQGTLEQGLDANGDPIDQTVEVGGEGRSASVLDRDAKDAKEAKARQDEEQLSRTSDA